MHVKEPASLLIKLLVLLTDTTAAVPKPLTTCHVISLSTPLRGTEIGTRVDITLLQDSHASHLLSVPLPSAAAPACAGQHGCPLPGCQLPSISPVGTGTLKQDG